MMVRTVDLDVISDVIAPAGSTPLHVAAMSGNVAILQAMLQVSFRQCDHRSHCTDNTYLPEVCQQPCLWHLAT